MQPNGNINYRNTFYALCPPLLTTGNGEKYMYTLQTCTDILLEKCNQAVKIRLPGVGDPSNIPYLSFDRQLIQGPNEPQSEFIQRLRTAFDAWGLAGSRLEVLNQIQTYLQGFQTGVTGTLPELTIVGGSYSTVTTWDQIYQGDAIGAVPTKTTVLPSNFNWDGQANFWRSWLVLSLYTVSTGLSGSSGSTGIATAGSKYYTTSGGVNGNQYGLVGSAVAQSGITYPETWIPNTTGTILNHPFLVVAGLSGLTAENVGDWITISGSSNPGNNGTFPIVEVNTASGCLIANPSGVASDAGPLTWSIGHYPFIGPGPVWGTPGIVFGQGELQTPPIDYGSNFQGIWKPTLSGAYQPNTVWGLSVPILFPTIIQSIRALLKQWKSAPTYYESIIFSFDSGDGTSGSAYSPNSSPGSGNPDGTFGGRGKNVNGVWVPNRLITSPYDCYAQGTGSWSACSVPNMT